MTALDFQRHFKKLKSDWKVIRVSDLLNSLQCSQSVAQLVRTATHYSTTAFLHRFQLSLIRGNHLALWSFPVMPNTKERVLLNAVVRRRPTRYPSALLADVFSEKQDTIYQQWNDCEKRRTWRFCLSFCWTTALENKNSSHGFRLWREAWQHSSDSASIISQKFVTWLCREQLCNQQSKLHSSIMTRTWTIVRKFWEWQWRNCRQLKHIVSFVELHIVRLGSKSWK